MIAMVQSLNFSVVSALILDKTQYQRQLAGLNQRSTSLLANCGQQQLFFKGNYPVLGTVAKQKTLPDPRIKKSAEVETSSGTWAWIQSSYK